MGKIEWVPKFFNLHHRIKRLRALWIADNPVGGHAALNQFRLSPETMASTLPRLRFVLLKNATLKFWR